MIGPLKAARERGVDDPARAVRRARERRRARRRRSWSCSHVGWVSGELAPAELAQVDVPVILDGAQGVGRRARRRGRARLRRLRRRRARSGCAAPTAPGCSTSRPAGASGSARSRPSYVSFEDTTRELESPYKDDARRYDTPSLSREAAALLARRARGARAPRLRRRPRARARAGRRRSPRRLEEAGRTVAPRGDTHARRLGGRRPRGHARPPARRPASSCATSPAARCCAPRSAPGTTSRDLERLLAALAPDDAHLARRARRAGDPTRAARQASVTCLSSRRG